MFKGDLNHSTFLRPSVVENTDFQIVSGQLILDWIGFVDVLICYNYILETAGRHAAQFYCLRQREGQNLSQGNGSNE